MSKRMSRRAFLRAAAGAAAVPYGVSAAALGGGDAPVASERIIMGAIGVGGQGTGDIQAMMGDPRVRYVAVCDVQRGLRERAKGLVDGHYKESGAGCAAYVDFRELLARPDIDAVNIATPDHWHAIIAIAAARAGKDMYGQKPLALTIGQGRAMVEAVRRYGVVFQTGTQQRSEKDFRRACELVRNGRLGTLQSIDVEVPGSMATETFEYGPAPAEVDYDLWLGPAPWRPYSPQTIHPFGWRWILDFAGGCVTDWGAHHIDIAQWAMGTTDTGPVEVEGKGYFPADGLFDAAASWRFEARYANGVTVTCLAKAPFTPGQYPNGITFRGSTGTLFVNRGSISAEPASILNEQIGPDEVQLYRSDNHYRNFVDCVISRAEPAAPAEEAHRSLSVCHLGNIAMQLGRKVRWNPDAETFVGDDEASRMLGRPMRSPWRL